jgi:hypothetical protein
MDHMQYPGYETGNVILSEGGWFSFRIHNLIQLQDNEWYYVLVDSNNMKHFMPSGYYTSYGFKINDVIRCKIARINCTGRIFLEPEHPYYSEGKTYLFEIVSERSTEGNDEFNEMLCVKDILGNCIEVALRGNTILKSTSNNNVPCMVKSIRKGQLILELYI